MPIRAHGARGPVGPSGPRRLPAGGPLSANPGGVNEISVVDDCDMGKLLEHLGLSPQLEYFAMINDDHVPSDTLTERALNEGDSIVLLPPLKGG